MFVVFDEKKVIIILYHIRDHHRRPSCTHHNRTIDSSINNIDQDIPNCIVVAITLEKQTCIGTEMYREDVAM